MRNTILQLFFACLAISAFAQQTEVKGTVLENGSNTTLIGVNVIVKGTTTGTQTDLDGNYTLMVPNGKLTIAFSFVGFETKEFEIDAKGQVITLNCTMGGNEIELKTVEVVADIASIDRQTPVAFSNISAQKLREELAGQDIPMLLNTTPGVYATQGGGGDGDARVTIRGFSQNNVAVMVDGVPVNDMENGQVYWSNWNSLDLVTKTMQVQRGLAASKLAIPSIGGTINILTKGIEEKRGISAQQEFNFGWRKYNPGLKWDGFNANSRTAVGLTTGRMKGGWGITSSFSYKKGEGMVEGTTTEAFIYYVRVDKQFGKHLLSFSAFGAPQQHGQRTGRLGIAGFNKDYAASLYNGNYGETPALLRERDSLNLRLGVRPPISSAERASVIARVNEINNFLAGNNFIDTTGVVERGRYYSNSWGNLERRLYRDGDTISAKTEQYIGNTNFYHKPQITLRHSAQLSDRFFLSTVAYLSLGNGGGASMDNSTLNPDGQLNLQTVWDNNTFPSGGVLDSTTSVIQRASMNNHYWYGLLSTMQYKISENLNFSGGVDLRSYQGDHYRKVIDVLNAQQGYQYNGAPRYPASTILKVDDRLDYDNTGYVRWGGVFGLLEYKKGPWAVFGNISAAATGFSLEDKYKAKVVNVKGFDGKDSTIYVTYTQPATYGGNTYTINSPEAKNQKIDWVTRYTYTFKAGASYQITKHHTVFANLGYMNRAQPYKNIVNENRNLANRPISKFGNFDNEIITAAELGYNFRSSKFSANMNAYYTYWQNKPLEQPFNYVPEPGADPIPVNIQGLNARHIGVEVDFAYVINKKLTWEGLASWGDWTWQSAGQSQVAIELPDRVIDTTFNFYAKDVHVGNAAQLQIGTSIRYEPIKGLFVKANGTYFGKNFANFNPENLAVSSGGKDSWQLPAYMFWNVNCGYNFTIQKVKMRASLSCLNIFDTFFITDAQDADTNITPSARLPRGSNANSASVYAGMGRRFNFTVGVAF